MTNRTTLTLMATAALMLCSACAEKPATHAAATFISPVNQQVSALQWDELTAASTAAHVNNNGLIIMR